MKIKILWAVELFDRDLAPFADAIHPKISKAYPILLGWRDSEDSSSYWDHLRVPLRHWRYLSEDYLEEKGKLRRILSRRNIREEWKPRSSVASFGVVWRSCSSASSNISWRWRKPVRLCCSFLSSSFSDVNFTQVNNNCTVEKDRKDNQKKEGRSFAVLNLIIFFPKGEICVLRERGSPLFNLAEKLKLTWWATATLFSNQSQPTKLPDSSSPMLSTPGFFSLSILFPKEWYIFSAEFKCRN